MEVAANTPVKRRLSSPDAQESRKGRLEESELGSPSPSAEPGRTVGRLGGVSGLENAGSTPAKRKASSQGAQGPQRGRLERSASASPSPSAESGREVERSMDVPEGATRPVSAPTSAQESREVGTDASDPMVTILVSQIQAFFAKGGERAGDFGRAVSALLRQYQSERVSAEQGPAAQGPAARVDPTPAGGGTSRGQRGTNRGKGDQNRARAERPSGSAWNTRNPQVHQPRKGTTPTPQQHRRRGGARREPAAPSGARKHSAPRRELRVASRSRVWVDVSRTPRVTPEGVRSCLESIGVLRYFYPVQREGVLQGAFVAFRDSWAAADAITRVPWGRRGARREWPDWRVTRARPRRTRDWLRQRLAAGRARSVQFTFSVSKAWRGRLSFREARGMLRTAVALRDMRWVDVKNVAPGKWEVTAYVRKDARIDGQGFAHRRFGRVWQINQVTTEGSPRAHERDGSDAA